MSGAALADAITTSAASATTIASASGFEVFGHEQYRQQGNEYYG